MRLFIFSCLNLLILSNLFSQNSLNGTIIESHSYDKELEKTLEKYTVFEMEIEKAAISLENTQSLFFDTGSMSFDLTVYPDNLSVSYKNNDIPHLLYGHSSEGESINMAINNEFIYGFVRIGEHRLFFEPLRYFDKSAPRNYFVSYWDYNVISTDKHVCGVTKTDAKTKELDVTNRMVTDECIYVEYALANTHDMVVEFGTVTDVEDFNLAVLNTVQANYRSEFDTNVEYDVVANFIPATAGDDPFTSSANANTLLNNFTNWADGGGNFGGASGGFGIDYQMAGLWTDRDIFTVSNGMTSFGVVGIAFTPGWHHLLENFTSNALQLQVMVSHEMGHNWDANHDAGSGFIMSASVNGTTTWSGTSVNAIDARIASQGFLDDCSDLGPPVGNFFQSTIITCEGGVVEFEDQSQYGATRVWEFENGTPATSTVEKETVTYNTVGQHYVKLTSTNDAGSDEYYYYVDVQTEPSNPCFPTGSGGGGGIVNVSLLNVANPSDDAGAAGRYEDFSCEQIMSLEADTDYDILISTSGGTGTNLRIYADFNGDGDFTDSGEAGPNYILGGGANYLIPFSTAANPVEDEIIRLRIINDTGTITSSCENPTYSQVEDYGVVFSSGFEAILGCTDPTASNYDPTANIDNGTCEFTSTTYYRDFDSDDFGDPNTSIVANSPPPGYILDNTDCDDTDETVYPGAPELCDGIINNCNLSFLLPIEVDNDIDGYVECNYNASTWKGSAGVIGGNDCDDTVATIFPGAPELCDGQRNDCNFTGIPADELDDDDDGFVECSYVAAIWVGDPTVIGGNDCDDTDDSRYPGAPEICDGQRNDCNLSGIPSDEIDNDNDDYVECGFVASIWKGDPTVIGGDDCDDADINNFPGNPEVCDGQDNDCDGLIDENCQPCDGINIIVNMITQNTYRAEQTITSTANVDEPSPVFFFAQDEIEFNNGFEVTLGTEFLAEIEECVVGTTFGSGGTVLITEASESKNKLYQLVNDLQIESRMENDPSIIIMSLRKELIYDGSKSELFETADEKVNSWFKPNTIYVIQIKDGDNYIFGKFIRH